MTQLLEVKGQIVARSAMFPKVQERISKTVIRSEMKPSAAGFSFNSELIDVLFRDIHRIFAMYRIPERRNVTLTGKNVRANGW